MCIYAWLIAYDEVWKVLEIFIVYKTGTKKRNENKFQKFIWFRGEGNNLLRFYKL